ncbi:FtsX-like permease family protein [Massilia sp. Dwa41.01b]|uniref:ABC transporter permease n=1 Tax=unclassified Massilia TaxID=2609279 RepID=UPI001601777D|nr:MULTISPECIES: ABC transporter permease [unclassified Massilia]QNA87577.1 FtsX-like permease family protein [Massilia sp. Dwa41.01b]QNA98481.1 FtsX-like permease family protein [Massilia sp. Se16.2.3]
MFSYYFKLGLRSLRRNPALTALMVLTLAVGVAASVSTLTILHMMSGDPIPHKSDRLFVPIFDVAPLDGYNPGEKLQENQVTYKDVVNLLKSGQGVRRTGLYGVGGPIEPPRKELPVFTAQGLAPTRDFFAMFDVPFLHGQAWSAQDDERGADVVVLSRETAEKLYGAADPVGQRLNLLGFPYTVVGVLDKWNPQPRYYKLVGGEQFGDAEEFFIPLASAIRHETTHNGGMNCSERSDPGFEGRLRSECTWFQFWFETRTASERAELKNYLDGYAAEQRKLGRMKRAAPIGLFNVTEWMEEREVVGKDTKLSAWLAFGFLLLCLVNTIGLLLAKFSVRAAEVGIRRALGASRREIFRQFLVESAVVGLAGGVLGLVLAFGALALIAMQSSEVAAIARMDLTMLAFTFALSVFAAVLAGLLPTWRACQVTPALQLKSQ